MATTLAPDQVFVVMKRFGGEFTDIRDFVRPRDVMVLDVLATRPTWTLDSIWRWVTQSIAYPPGSLLMLDYHEFAAFRRPIPIIGSLFPGITYRTVDYWEFPAETLRDRMADCEGSAALMVSMARAVDPSAEVYATVGMWREFGHVWVSARQGREWLIYDTTLPPDALPSEPLVESSTSAYVPILRFNDQIVIIEADLPLPERTRDLGHRRRRLLQSWYEIVRVSHATQ